MMLRLVERSSEPAVTLQEMALHLKREDTTEDDEYIEQCANAATEWAEFFTGRALVDQTWDFYFDEFPDGLTNYAKSIYIPKPPLIEIIGVWGRDTTEAAFSDYAIDYGDNDRARIYLTSTGSWPSIDSAPNAGRIRFRAGYIDTTGSPIADGAIPEAIKMGIKIYAATLYAQRELVQSGSSPVRAPWGAESLLRAYRVENSLA